ncbi:saccharopine dehydrogenase C-terminal domain-containing protein [Lunatibacter salilacus]|uniref:saccharopine dehydrogenase C-terminal domain-containing protein n=1 Tax=Lunatibacter salilacus TaxID=2483804 RepID=UPI00131DBC54|nr:saccharopine dehydrogenase C-terminal domain-containing protein [Lunatibacter salilacus]
MQEKNILILGAGKSATVLIDYLLRDAEKKLRKFVIADVSLEAAEQKVKGHPSATAKALGIENEAERKGLIQQADLVISMLPPSFHPLVAADCVAMSKHFFSASYSSAEMKKLESEIKEKSLFFLNECGLDPGLDHMSAMQLMDREREQGHTITLYKSFCGGLMSPEYVDNPWNYKFTWSPRNVVLAGQGVSSFIRNGYYKFIPYHMLFKRTEEVHFPGLGTFEGYPNRDSLSYREIYGLQDIPTILRGTLRTQGFCQAWNVLVQLGLTDDSYEMDLPKGFTYRMLTNTFLPYDPNKSVEVKIKALLPEVTDAILAKLAWLGLFEDGPLALRKGSPAKILQKLLEEKWNLKLGDKDMVLMQHQVEVQVGERVKRLVSSLTVKGDDQAHTAMAKTVGLPLGIAVDLFLEDKFSSRGLLLPTRKEIYEPVLQQLRVEGISFEESESWIDEK